MLFGDVGIVRIGDVNREQTLGSVGGTTLRRKEIKSVSIGTKRNIQHTCGNRVIEF